MRSVAIRYSLKAPAVKDVDPNYAAAFGNLGSVEAGLVGRDVLLLRVAERSDFVALQPLTGQVPKGDVLIGRAGRLRRRPRA